MPLGGQSSPRRYARRERSVAGLRPSYTNDRRSPSCGSVGDRPQRARDARRLYWMLKGSGLFFWSAVAQHRFGFFTVHLLSRVGIRSGRTAKKAKAELSLRTPKKATILARRRRQMQLVPRRLVRHPLEPFLSQLGPLVPLWLWPPRHRRLAFARSSLGPT